MKFFTAVLACVVIWGAFAESHHPCVYFRAGELPSLREKAQNVAWAREIVARWHRDVDSAVARHADDPSFAPVFYWGASPYFTAFGSLPVFEINSEGLQRGSATTSPHASRG